MENSTEMENRGRDRGLEVGGGGGALRHAHAGREREGALRHTEGKTVV